MVAENKHLSVVASPQTEGSATPLEDRTDDELMLLARGGVNAAFANLIRRHQQSVIRFTCKFLMDSELAQDAAQEAFAHIFRNLHRYDPRGRFTAYLFKVAVNECRMLARQARRRHRLQAAAREAPRLPDEPLIEEIVLTQERRRLVAEAMHKLPQRLREVIQLRFAAGLSTAAVAETLSLPVGTVKSRTFDGLRRLRETLERGGGTR